MRVTFKVWLTSSKPLPKVEIFKMSMMTPGAPWWDKIVHTSLEVSGRVPGLGEREDMALGQQRG